MTYEWLKQVWICQLKGQSHLVRGPLEIAGGGDLVKSPGEPEGRILGELEWPWRPWASTARPRMGSTMSGRLGFTRLRAIGLGLGVYPVELRNLSTCGRENGIMFCWQIILFESKLWFALSVDQLEMDAELDENVLNVNDGQPCLEKGDRGSTPLGWLLRHKRGTEVWRSWNI